MARPITWQDVAAPNQGAALAAAQAAGDTIRNSLTGLGNTAEGYADSLKEDATKAAVASVMASSDPMAAAAALPQGWKIDPLAVQAAANSTDARLRGNKASDAALEAANVDIQRNRAQVEDIQSNRNAAVLAGNFLKKMPKNGDITGIDITSPEFEGVDGNKALATILDESDRRAGRDLQSQELSINRARALRENKMENLKLAQLKADGEFYDWSGNAGQNADPGKVAAMATQIAQANGLPASYTENLVPLHGTAAARFQPAANQWAEKVPGQDYTFKDLDRTLRTAESAATTKNAADIGRFEQLNNTSANLAKSAYDGMTDSAAAAALAKQYGWDVGDALERMESAQSSVPKGPDGKRPTLTVAQKAEVAALTEGSPLGVVSDYLANTDAAKSRLAEYSALQQEGGAGVVADKLSKVQGELAANQAAFEGQRRQLYSSARGNGDAPAQLVKERAKQVEAQRLQLLAEQKAHLADSDAAQSEIDRALARSKPTPQLQLPGALLMK